MKTKLGGYKMKPEAIIPTKTERNAGFDIYTIDKDVGLKPHCQNLFATGLGVAVEEGGWLKADDRGSTGSRGIHTHCGVIDNNYRGELFICLKNDNAYPIYFTNKRPMGFYRKGYGRKYFVYNTEKAIAQVMLIPQPEVDSCELTTDEGNIAKNTDRGEGKLGSSGK